MRLTDDAVKSMAIGAVFKDNTNKINSLDFHQDGELLVTAADDESVHLYDTNTGVLKKTLYSKKYGVNLIRFTHNQAEVICASNNGWDESIRYLALQNNKYISYFKGHRDRVVSLIMSPVDETFVSGSLDETVRVWDLRASGCQGLLRRKGITSLAFDPKGIVLAAAVESNQVILFDLQSYEKGPFAAFSLGHSRKLNLHTMKFSSDGRYLLISTDDSIIYLIDAFTGSTVQTYQWYSSQSGTCREASFSPDGQYVLSGSETGEIHIWQTLTGKEVAVLQGHTSDVGVVQWNPKTVMMASGCSSLVFWIPSNIDSD